MDTEASDPALVARPAPSIGQPRFESGAPCGPATVIDGLPIRLLSYLCPQEPSGKSNGYQVYSRRVSGAVWGLSDDLARG
jgi:hypothetical protein